MVVAPIIGLFILRFALLSIEFSAIAFGKAAIHLALQSCRRRSFSLAKAAIYIAAIADCGFRRSRPCIPI